MKSFTLFITICAVIGCGIMLCPVTAREADQMTEKKFILRPIGSVHKENERTTLVLKKDMKPALRGLDGFSHVWVLWWCEGNDTEKKRSTLQVHPQGNKENPITGVFACRAPVRPNLIALTLCRVLTVTDNVVEIDEIDAFTDTPVLDLKPYIPSCDSVTASIPDWLKNSE